MSDVKAGAFCIEHDLTIYTADETKKQMVEMIGKSVNIDLDLSAVGEIDTSGLQLLVMLKNECIARQGSLKMSKSSQPVINMLKMIGMTEYFDL